MTKIRDEVVIKAFGNRVRELRIERGYTMEKLAELAGIDYRQLAYIEHGKTNVTISTISVLGNALELKFTDLFSL